MPRYTKAEIRDRIKSLDAMRKQRAQLEKRIKAVEEELKAASADNSITMGADDWGFKNIQSIAWQTFNKQRAAQDFGIETFPQIYEPGYKATKELLNQINNLPADSMEAVSAYCKTSNRIDVIRPEV